MFTDFTITLFPKHNEPEEPSLSTVNLCTLKHCSCLASLKWLEAFSAFRHNAARDDRAHEPVWPPASITGGMRLVRWKAL